MKPPSITYWDIRPQRWELWVPLILPSISLARTVSELDSPDPETTRHGLARHLGAMLRTVRTKNSLVSLSLRQTNLGWS